MPALLRSRLASSGALLLVVSALWLPAVGVRSQSFLGADHQTAPSRIETPAHPSPGGLTLEERADIYMARKSYADAVDYYYRALKQPALSTHDAAKIWNKLGIAYQQQENFNAAARAYKRAIGIQADFPEPLNNLGTDFYVAGKIKKSIKYYVRAIKLSPNSASFHMNLGTGYYRLKKYKQMGEEYTTALTLDPDILTEHSETGTIMETRGADAKFYFYLAKSLAKTGRIEEAIRYLRRAFEDGFKNQKLLAEDPDFQKLSQNPAYLDLIKNPPAPIRD